MRLQRSCLGPPGPGFPRARPEGNAPPHAPTSFASWRVHHRVHSFLHQNGAPKPSSSGGGAGCRAGGRGRALAGLKRMWQGRRMGPLIRVLHLADLHLGYEPPWSGIAKARRKERDGRLAKAVAWALQNDIDLVLIAGDLFETHRPPAELVDTVIREL